MAVNFCMMQLQMHHSEGPGSSFFSLGKKKEKKEITIFTSRFGAPHTFRGQPTPQGMLVQHGGGKALGRCYCAFQHLK